MTSWNVSCSQVEPCTDIPPFNCVEYGEFQHKPGEKFYDFHEVRAEVQPLPDAKHTTGVVACAVDTH